MITDITNMISSRSFMQVSRRKRTCIFDVFTCRVCWISDQRYHWLLFHFAPAFPPFESVPRPWVYPTPITPRDDPLHITEHVFVVDQGSSQHPVRRRQTPVTLLDILKQRDIAASMLHILYRSTIRHVSTISHLGASQVAVETEGNTRDEDAQVRIYVPSRF
jgi:hypothetical protein